MELFSIRIQRTFQLVSTSQDVLLAVLPVKMRHTRIYSQDDYHPVLFQGIRTIQLKLP